jgi:predicted Zn-dependent protease with MMP-like domain
MTRSEFERLVRQALEQIPEEIRVRLENVDIAVDAWPTKEQLAGSDLEDGEYLLGLYEGIPLTERYGYDMVLPDKITLFQEPIEAICSSKEEMVEEIKRTVVHEVAHYFGIDDDKLERLGLG